MNLPSVIVVIVMGAIILVSLFAPGAGPDPRTAQASELAWAGLFLAAGLLELVLILAGAPTLSSQMQHWVRRLPAGLFMVVFWGWLTFHFVLEPVVRGASSLLERLLR
ncbi:MAG: hypothetical protein ACRD1K_20615 [Acidimicrobiales bacterium]